MSDYDWDAALAASAAEAQAMREEFAERLAAEPTFRTEPDLSVGNVALAINERIRPCDYCDKPILPQAGVVSHTPSPRVSVVRRHYHPSCIDMEGL